MSAASPDAIRVLHVDDEPGFADLAATFLEREGDRVVVETATNASEGLDRLDDGVFDCIVSDYDMPGTNGIAFLEAVRDEYPDLPFILFTGKGSEEIASDAISAGVTDYLQKERGTDQYTVLANRVTNAVEHYRSQRAVERSEQRLREIVDALPHLLYVVDEEGTYLLANEALADFHDAAVSAVEGAHVTDMLDEPTARQFMRDVEGVLESDAPKRIPEVAVADATGEEHVFAPRLLPYDLAETDRRTVLGIAVDITERRERERTLERARDRMQLALERTDSVLFEIDFDTGAVVRHGSFERFFDFSPDELPTWRDHMNDAVHPDDRDAFREFHQELIDGERESGEIEYRTNPETGSVRWIRAAVHVEESDDGRRAVGISRDITEYKQRERERERATVLLSTLFDALPVGVLAEDESRNVLSVNDQLVDLFDVPATPDELVGADCRRLAEEASDAFVDPEGFVERTDDLVARRVPVRNEELPLEDGRTLDRSYHPIELADGDGHLWVYRDVTDRTERERRLEALNETTRQVMAADTRETVAELGVEAAREVLGLEANAIHLYDDEVSGLVPVAATEAVQDLVDELPTFTGEDSIAWRVYDRGDPLVVDDVHGDPDVHNPDSPIHSELYLPLGEYGVLIAGSTEPAAFDQSDRVLGEILAGNVATALEQAERTEQLRARERELTCRNDRLEEFASIVSHDLRNPLNVAQGRLELARDEGGDDHLEAVSQAHDRMEALVDDLLALAREGDRVSEVGPVDLGELVRNCWQNVETAGATLVSESDRTILADSTRLQQLLENLFRNAVEHGSTNPRSQAPEDAVEHGSTSPDSHAPEDAVEHGGGVTVTVGDTPTGFYVEDDGTGITEAERDRVFEVGHSTSDEGTGFGLSIVEQVAEAHGWEVTVTDSPDGGARFEVTGVDVVS